MKQDGNLPQRRTRIMDETAARPLRAGCHVIQREWPQPVPSISTPAAGRLRPSQPTTAARRAIRPSHTLLMVR